MSEHDAVEAAREIHVPKVVAYDSHLEAGIRPVIETAQDRRKALRAKTEQGLTEIFPIKGRQKTLTVENVKTRPAVYSMQDQKTALLHGRSLAEPVVGDLVLRDNVTGEELDRKKNHVLAHMPYFTERHTFVLGGNEYELPHQVRLDAGVYTRERGNGELETSFNLSKGRNFRLTMAPDTGKLRMELGTSVLPLRPVLEHLGVSPDSLRKAWGEDLYAQNASTDNTHESTLTKLVDKLSHPGEVTPSDRESQRAWARDRLDRTRMNPRVAQTTIGVAHDRASPQAILDASKKLLRAHRGDASAFDDRDSLEFKHLMRAEDFFHERLLKDAKRTIGPKIGWKLDRAAPGAKLKDLIPSSTFTKSLNTFLTNSAIASIPTQYNPIEILDHAAKVTSLGEGGIGSERAVSMESRGVHGSSIGIMDPVRTPEGGHSGVDVRAAIGAHKDEHGHLYGTFIDRHGKAVLVPASIIARSVIGHAHEYQRGGARVDALEGTDNIRTPRKNVDYWVPNPTSLFSPATNLIPFIDGIQGNRAIMGAKFQTQSLPLVDKEAPLVRPSSMDGVTPMTELLGAFIDPTSPVAGTVTKIDPHYIYVKRDAQTSKKAASDGADAAHMPRVETHRHVEVPAEAATHDLFDIPDDAWTIDGTPLESVWFGARAEILVPGSSPDDALEKIALDAGSPAGAKPASSYAPGSALRAVREEQARAHHDDTDTVRIPYYDRFPLATKTELHHDLSAKVGDRVAAGASLGTSNFTADGHVANGRNLSVAYIAYYGKNSNDAVVISDAAADKLTSEHAYKETLLKTKDTLQGKAKFQAYFPTKYTAAQLGKLDDRGVAKPGSSFDPGDPLILALEPSTVTPEERLLGNLHKSLVKPFRNASVIWEHVTAGKASEVSDIARQTTVVMQTREKMKVGDKLSNRFGGKGVVADILPNEHMIQDAKGKPIDILFTSAGINSRINPAQVVEVALGKVAQHTGQPISVPQFAEGDNVKFARDLLKKHGLSDKETVYDPIGDRHIPNIHVGTSYIHKLFKNTETNFSARGVAGYDVNKQPTKGGVGGAKGLGRMEINTFLAHDARHFLRDAFTHKSEQSESFWRSFEHGMPLPGRKTPFVTEKLLAMLGGAGIAAKREGSLLRLAPMRDEDVRAMSSGALRPPSLEHSTSFLVSAKKLEPEKGGLFDPSLTGGVTGTKWSHIELPERTVQPAFFDATRVILGTTAQQLRDKIAEGGGEAVAKALDEHTVDERLKKLYVENKTLRGAALDKNVKAIKYLEALKQQGIDHASEAYTAKLVAVIPPVMRPILPSRGSADLQVADANYLYRDVALAAKNLESAHTTGSPTLVSEARKHLYDAHAALAGVGEPVSPQLQGRDVKGFVQTITGSGSPKTGFLFSKVIKRQHDLTGRATATPDATLELDQIGVPEDILWTTYGKFVMRGLIAQGYAPVAARELLEKRSPLAKAVLERELKERPVYVNRAPSLHKHNMVAAYPVSVSGTNLRVNPFMEKGMNLDYDGDTMQVHVPLSDAAKHEAKQLTMKQLLFSDRTRDDLLVFPQHEAIIGAYLATRGAAKGAVKKFATKSDAQAAYRRGEIGLDTPVEIGASS
jgi:DNA-directed RNA polymerase beta subunit